MLHSIQGLSLMCESRDGIDYEIISCTTTSSFSRSLLENYWGTAPINPVYSGPSVDQDNAVKEHKIVACRPKLDFPCSTIWPLPFYSAHYNLSKAHFWSKASKGFSSLLSLFEFVFRVSQS